LHRAVCSIAGKRRQVSVKVQEQAVTAALEVQGFNRSFGALPVTRNVNLTLERGARRG